MPRRVQATGMAQARNGQAVTSAKDDGAATNRIAENVLRALKAHPVAMEALLVAMHAAGRAAARALGDFLVSGASPTALLSEEAPSPKRKAGARTKSRRAESRAAMDPIATLDPPGESDKDPGYHFFQELVRLLETSLLSLSATDARHFAVCEEASSLLLRLFDRDPSGATARLSSERLLGRLLQAFEAQPQLGISSLALAVTLLMAEGTAAPDGSDDAQERLKAEYKQSGSGGFGAEMVGQRLQVRGGDEEWRDGLVAAFHPEVGAHEMAYDDLADDKNGAGRSRPVFLGFTTWRVVST